MPPIEPERPSSQSRFNRVATQIIEVGTALTVATLSSNPWISTMVGTLATTGMIYGWTRFYAGVFVNRNHQPQTLYTVPWQDGVLVTQPVHHLELNPWRWWRGRYRDTITDQVYLLHGYFATETLAMQYCQNVMKVGVPIALSDAESDPTLRALVKHTIQEAGRQVKDPQVKDPLRITSEPMMPWNVSALPTDPHQYCAYRQVLTSDGPRWEFFPDPPPGYVDTAALKSQLASRYSVLDHRHLIPLLFQR